MTPRTPATPPLPPGVYDHPLTRALARSVSAAALPTQHSTSPVEDDDAAALFARHLSTEFSRLLASIPAKDRAAHALELANHLLALLPTLVTGDAIDADSFLDAQLEPPPRRLTSVYTGVAPARPLSPLAASTLFTRGRGEPALGSELSREIACADRVDALVAFITTSGVRSLRPALEQLAQRAPSAETPTLRVLTTTFTGTTEVAAIEQLARLPGSRVKISYDTRRTRLHAKAWLFHRESGLTTTYVGSANLTATALGSGHEWMLKVSATDLADVVAKFRGTFETLWNDEEFEAYDPANPAHRERLVDALGRERGERDGSVVTLYSLRPYPFQEAILDRLRVEREVLGLTRNLVVAATGTGKTVIAAFDYARMAESAGVRPRLLFVAHRLEILEQARDTFRQVLHDGAFGELHGGRRESARGEHVFATIQSAGALCERFAPEHWQHVVIDECHHAPAPSYRAIVERLQPVTLLGLTATPERSDGRSLLPDFGGRVSAELRLWHAMEQQLLVPFEYYGLADGIDLSRVEWTRTGYASEALSNLYTGNDARVQLVLAQLERRVSSLTAVRGLGFCVSVEHAEFMARAFTARGVPSIALHGESTGELRESAKRLLREREASFVFTCDLYNEGVDLPYVDTILLLRPTMSATLFMQQLGRGLRQYKQKTSCLVLDFIGQHRKEFRFDNVLTALTGVPRAGLMTAVKSGFPFLPSGCSVSLDHVATEHVLTSLRGAVRGAQKLATELREIAGDADPAKVSLARFLSETSRELYDVYGADYGWAKIRRLAGATDVDDRAEGISRQLGTLLHVDEPARLHAYRALAAGAPVPTEARAARQYLMLDAQMHNRGLLRTAEETAAYLTEQQTTADELATLTEILAENVATPIDKYPVPEWSLALHRQYKAREILTAVGRLVPGGKKFVPVGGVMKVGDSKRELLFITLDKTDHTFSPTTRYRDYAISRDRFHWETQGAASVTRPSGRRYLESPANGWSFFLFVRTSRQAPYAFLGPGVYESHSGDRPVSIVWRLAYPMPAGLFERMALLAQG